MLVEGSLPDIYLYITWLYGLCLNIAVIATFKLNENPNDPGERKLGSPEWEGAINTASYVLGGITTSLAILWVTFFTPEQYRILMEQLEPKDRTLVNKIIKLNFATFWDNYFNLFFL